MIVSAIIRRIHSWYWRRRCLKTAPNAYEITEVYESKRYGRIPETFILDGFERLTPYLRGLGRSGNAWRQAALYVESKKTVNTPRWRRA